jgi:5-methylcytosine-specific restriction endonuclease McrA
LDDALVRVLDRHRLYRRVHASGRWQRIRRDALARSGGFCERCGRQFGRRWRARATVHRRQDVELGHETVADVEALCQLCHAEEHGFVPAWAR